MLKDASARNAPRWPASATRRTGAVLHRDPSLMPRRRRCWASWVYTSDGEFLHPKITVTYWMNLLQGIDQHYPLFVSLNPKREIPEHLVFDQTEFDHPVFDQDAIAAQGRIAGLQGTRGTWFAGAHLGHGFHEDGLVQRGQGGARAGRRIPWEERAAARRRAAAKKPPAGFAAGISATWPGARVIVLSRARA